MVISSKPANLQWGDPFQAWKWPAVVITAYWGTVKYTESVGSGFFVGQIIGISIVFILFTKLWRWTAPSKESPLMQWWKWAIAANTAAVFSVPISTNTGGLASFVWFYVGLGLLFSGFTAAVRGGRVGIALFKQLGS